MDLLERLYKKGNGDELSSFQRQTANRRRIRLMATVSYVVLKQMVKRIIGVHKDVHDRCEKAQGNIKRWLHGNNLCREQQWIPLGIPEARFHLHFIGYCLMYLAIAVEVVVVDVDVVAVMIAHLLMVLLLWLNKLSISSDPVESPLNYECKWFAQWNETRNRPFARNCPHFSAFWLLIFLYFLRNLSLDCDFVKYVVFQPESVKLVSIILTSKCGWWAEKRHIRLSIDNTTLSCIHKNLLCYDAIVQVCEHIYWQSLILQLVAIGPTRTAIYGNADRCM